MTTKRRSEKKKQRQKHLRKIKHLTNVIKQKERKESEPTFDPLLKKVGIALIYCQLIESFLQKALELAFPEKYAKATHKYKKLWFTPIGPKVNILAKKIKGDPDFLQRLKDWKNERDTLAHHFFFITSHPPDSTDAWDDREKWINNFLKETNEILYATFGIMLFLDNVERDEFQDPSDINKDVMRLFEFDIPSAAKMFGHLKSS